MIRLDHVEKGYKIGENAISALKSVSLNVGFGEFVAIVGTSGSGKSTLMNILGCLDKPNGGEYYLDGERVLGLSERSLSVIRNKKIGFVFQSFNLISGLTAWENIELPLIYRKTPKKEREKLVAGALEMVALTQRKNHKPTELSGGQQQRVAIARAIAAKPPLILADEPCGNLDSKAGGGVMEIFKQLNKEGRTIVLITHDDKAAKQAARIVRINDGVLVE